MLVTKIAKYNEENNGNWFYNITKARNLSYEWLVMFEEPVALYLLGCLQEQPCYSKRNIYTSGSCINTKY